MKTLRCKDAGFDCPKEIKAESEEEVLRQAAIHAQQDHHVEVTPAMAEQIKMLIRDEDDQMNRS